MAAPDEELILLGGELILDPASTTPPAFGGTRLGTIQEIALELVFVTDELEGDEYGGEVVDELARYEEWAGSAVIAGWDPDAVTAFPPSVASGSGSVPVVTAPGLTPGTWWATQAHGLLLAPTDSRRPGFYLPNAVLRPDRSARLQFSHYDEGRLLVSFRGFRNASNVKAKLGQVADLGIA